MRFVKPGWLTHAGEKKDHEVYSCHVSPDGSRLATAGGDGHVRVWSTAAILAGGDPSQPRQLASLAHHSGTVHAVRFSGNGRYLASGADDKMVCVYNLEAGAPPPTFGSKGEQAVENWRMYRRLIGHENDVQDLGWSNDSSILVSVGLDSKVVVWSGSTFERLKTLAQHQSHVKGITFDPANKYFATASDDRSVKIYRFTSPAANATAYDSTSNFTLESTITAPFGTSPLTTYFRRCSWSPDGEHIAAANATNGPVSSVAIVGRGKWDDCSINLIGHEGPVEVCAFSPRMFCREPQPKESVNGAPAPAAVTVIACAGQDRTLSVWNTSFPRPFFTSMEMSAKSISDLAWHPNGETIFVTSLDGTIGAFVFQEGELGYPALLADSDKILAKYGVGRKTGIIEGADALRLEEGSKAGELKHVEGRMGELMGDADSHAGALTNGDVHMNGGATPNGVQEEQTPAPPPPKDPQQEKVDKLKQRVTITKDGKKRIAPLLVSSSNQGEMNLPKSQLQAAVRGGAASDEPGGKPLDLSTPYNGLPKGGLASLLIGNKRKYAEVEDGEDRAHEKRVHAIREQAGAVPILNNTAEGLVPSTAAEAARRAAERAEIPEVLRPAITNPSLTVSSIRLAIPTVRHVILRPIDPSKSNADGDAAPTEPDSDHNIVFEARNATGPSRTGRAAERDPTRITLSRRSQTLWQDFLHKAALLTTGNRHFWAVGCEDGSLHVWTPAGRRLMNALVLEAQPVILDCRGWWLMCVTAVGQVYVWDIRTMSAKHPPVSLAPVLDAASLTQSQQGHLTNAPSLMFARLNGEGRVVVAMSNGDGYAYNSMMCVWQRLSETWWAVGSQYWNTTDTSTTAASVSGAAKANKQTNGILDDIKPENISAGIIPLLERNTTSLALLRGRASALQRIVKALLSAEGYEGFESAVSIAHLENRVAAAYTLGARDEFKVYLIMYAKRIGAEGLRGKVEELLRSLTGSLFSDEDGEEDVGEAEGIDWSSGSTTGDGNDIVGWKREDLLREVVMVLGKHRDLQRVTVPYARVLGVLDGQQSGEGDVAMITES